MRERKEIQSPTFLQFHKHNVTRSIIVLKNRSTKLTNPQFAKTTE